MAPSRRGHRRTRLWKDAGMAMDEGSLDSK
jgi:hypothetical protein